MATQLRLSPAKGAGLWPSPSPVVAFQAQARALTGGGEDFRDGKPTLAYVKRIPKTFASMTNDQVLHFAEMGIPEACRECVVRDIMDVDQVEYDEVSVIKVCGIDLTNVEAGMKEASCQI